MKACEIFQNATPALTLQIIGYLKQEHKPVYRATIQTLAQQRKLRPVFIEKKSGPEQVRWIIDTLKLKTSEAVGEQLLQVWLMKGQSAMLSTFVDALGLKHENGVVDGDVPEDFEPAKVKEGIEKMLAAFPAEHVATYLHMFQLQQEGGYPAITEAMANEPRLKIGA